MSAGTYGQIIVAWLIVGALLAPFIGRSLRSRKAHKELTALYERERKARIERLRTALELADQMKSDGAVPIPENPWLANARRAEALGFLDDNYPEPPRGAA